MLVRPRVLLTVVARALCALDQLNHRECEVGTAVRDVAIEARESETRFEEDVGRQGSGNDIVKSFNASEHGYNRNI